MSKKSIDSIAANQYKLVFDVDRPTFEAAINKVFKKQNKNITIPGFRKGHAPRAIVEKMYGKEVFYEDAINEIIPGAYTEAMEGFDKTVVSRPEFDVETIDDNGVTLTATFFVKPDAEIADYLGIPVERDEKEATDAEVDEELSRVQQRNSRMIEVTDRPAQIGDSANIDFEGTIDGVPFEGGTAQGQTLKIGSGSFIPGFEEQMVGMTVGEEKDLNVTFPEKYHAENLAGKNAVFHVKVNSITKTELPELDDDFAQDNGFDTFDAYKADVAKKLQEIADTNYDVEIENALIEKAVANAQMDIPAAMIDDQLNYVMRDVEYSMMRQGLRMEDYLKYTGQTREQMAQQYRGEAENRVKIQLVLEAIRKAENIEPTAEDIDEQSAKQAKRAGQEVEAFKANLTDEHKAYLSDLAAIQKVCDLMKAGATVVDKKPEEAAETAEETKTEE